MIGLSFEPAVRDQGQRALLEAVRERDTGGDPPPRGIPAGTEGNEGSRTPVQDFGRAGLRGCLPASDERQASPYMTSLYASLLMSVMEEEPAETQEGLAEVIGQVFRARAYFDHQRDPAARASSADRARTALDYDRRLILLCRQLGVEHSFFDRISPQDARLRTESDLMVRLPALAEFLDRDSGVEAASSAEDDMSTELHQPGEPRDR